MLFWSLFSTKDFAILGMFVTHPSAYRGKDHSTWTLPLFIKHFCSGMSSKKTCFFLKVFIWLCSGISSKKMIFSWKFLYDFYMTLLPGNTGGGGGGTLLLISCHRQIAKFQSFMIFIEISIKLPSKNSHNTYHNCHQNHHNFHQNLFDF